MGLSCAQIMRDKPPTGRRVVCHDGAIVHDLEGIVRQLRVCGDGLADGCQLNLARREVKLESICAPPDSDRHDDVLWSTRFSFLPTPMSDNKRTANSLTGLRAHQPAATPIPPSLQAKMAAFAQRAASNNPNNNIGPNSHPVLHPASSFPPPPPRPSKPAGMAARRARPNFTLRDIESVVLPDGPVAAGLGAGRPSLFQQETPRRPQAGNFGTPFANFSKIVYASHCFFISLCYSLPIFSDPSGALNFNGKAILHAAGVNFSNGASFSINMDQLQLDEELGRGNYGTVKKVLHKPTNVAMAMKAGRG